MIKQKLIFSAVLALASFSAASQTQTSIKTMETLGFKIGDTPAQVEKIVLSQGYVVNNKSMHPPSLGLPERVSTLMFEKKGANNSVDGAVEVAFGPVSGKALAVARVEKYGKTVLVSELSKALVEKYGQPTRLVGHTALWEEARAGKEKESAIKGGCNPGFYFVTNYSNMLEGRSHCKRALHVLMGAGGSEAREIKVNMVDFENYVDEFLKLDKFNQEVARQQLEKKKQEAVPKL